MGFIVLIFIANTLLTLTFIGLNKKEKDMLILTPMFFVVPIFGILMYFIPHGAYKLIRQKNLYDHEDLIFKKEKEIYESKPRMKEELDVIPFDEALAVSDVHEKRGLLLEILKEDMKENYKIIKSALEDKDSETSHYAAAATMEISRKMRNSIQEIESIFLQNKENADIRRRFIDELYEYIHSGVLSSRDRILHIMKYMKVIEETIQTCKEVTTQSDYIHQIEFLMESNQLYEAEKLAQIRRNEYEDEEIYEKLMEIYYRLKNKRKFEQTLNRLLESNVVLSAKGIESVRFWLSRR